MNILLVSPELAFEKNKTRNVSSELGALNFFSKKAFLAPLTLTTVAALAPDDVEVDIWDESVRGMISDRTDLKKDYDLLGITGYSSDISRVKQIGRIFRNRGIKVAVGGPGVSTEPERYRDHFDILFIGEAEHTWPQFIADWKSGSFRPEYRQLTKVDMKCSPLPRWDIIANDMRYYFAGGLQATRGCPRDCEFCDVIYLNGRQVRSKSIEQVLEEVCTLERLGVTCIFISDDNFIGNPRYAKSLLRELIPLNQSFRRPMEFFTQITINVAKDDELLALLADANFSVLSIGIETPNIESLVEIKKSWNHRTETDIVEDVKKIHSYGIPVAAGMIVGFDQDDKTIFDRQFNFMQECGIPNPSIATLKAIFGTKLWVRLNEEGRLVQLSDQESNTPVGQDLPSGDDADGDSFLADPSRTNIIPKQMTRIELLSGYRDLVRRVRDWRNFEFRLKGMISQTSRRPNVKRAPLSLEQMILSLRFLKFVIFSMEREARGVIFRMIYYTAKRAPFMMNRVIRMIGRQYIEVVPLQLMIRSIDEQIQMETKMDLGSE